MTTKDTVVADTAKKASVGSLDWVRQQASERLNTALPYDDYIFIHEVFPDRIIAESGASLVEFSYTVNDGELTLSDPNEVSVEYVAKAQQATRGGELTGPFVMKDEAKRIAYAAVLVPGEEDSDGETVTKEQIESVAHDWMASYRNIDMEHTLNDADAVPVESYVTPTAMTVEISGKEVELPEGSWILAGKFRDEDTWDRVEKGELGGWSVMGVPRAAAAAMKSATSPEVAIKRTLLRDLGPDWIATHVSVVGQPAVPKAKWFALKSADSPEEPGVVKRLFGRLTGDPAVKEGRKLSKANRDKLATIISMANEMLSLDDPAPPAPSEKSTDKENDVDPEALKAAVDGAVKEAITPLTERLDDFEKRVAPKSDDSGESAKDENDSGSETDDAKDDAATKADDDDRVAELETQLAAEKQAREDLEKDLTERVNKAVRGTSKQLDDPAPNDRSTKSKSNRDAFGRRQARS